MRGRRAEARTGRHASAWACATLLVLAWIAGTAAQGIPREGTGAAAPSATGWVPGGDHAFDTHLLENAGQVSNRAVRYYGASGDLLVGFTDGGVLYRLVSPHGRPLHDTSSRSTASPTGPGEDAPPGEVAAALVRLSFDDARAVAPAGRGELPHRSHFFLGNDPDNWVRGVRSYEEVVYEDLYEGIDLVYRLAPEGLKYEFHVDPGADPARIAMRYEGATSVRLEASGGLIVETAAGDLRDGAPIAWQGDAPVRCGLAMRAHVAGFACEGWDPSRPGVIDPLVYATYLGGAHIDDPYGVAVDASGSVYVTGRTFSVDFPVTAGAFGETLGPSSDAFVAKLDPAGSALVFATYLGGTGGEQGRGIAVDVDGSVHVAGRTGAADFPTTPGAYQGSYGGAWDAFVAKLAPAGDDLAYSTYLGGWDEDSAEALVRDSGGAAIVAGYTKSPDFPATPGAFDETYNGGRDAFVAKLDPEGGALAYATYLGGSDPDHAWSLALDWTGDVLVAGSTASPDFPVTPDAFDPTLDTGENDGFIGRLSAAGDALAYASFVGGSGPDSAFAVAVDPAGNAFITGYTISSDFPVTAGAFDTTWSGYSDAFVLALAPSGFLAYATFLGGNSTSNSEVGIGIALDPSGRAYVVGLTDAPDFPVTPDAFDATYDAYDAFLAILSADGAMLEYATFLGGSDYDDAERVALDPARGVYVVGGTLSSDFPVTPGAFDGSFNGAPDTFVAKFDFGTPPNTPPALSWTGEPGYAADGLDPEAGTPATPFAYRVAYSDADNDPPYGIEVRVERPLGTPHATLPLVLDAWLGAPGNFTQGALFRANATLPGGTDWWYAFNATDGRDWAAGAPTAPVDAPDVTGDGPPVAVAAADPAVADLDTPVTFDGTASSDDVGIVAYRWDFGDGAWADTAVATHTYGSRATFAAVLTVRDGANQTGTDGVSVEVRNRPPVADAGPDQAVLRNTPVSLSGSGTDADGDALTYAWTQTGGPPVALAGADTATPTFTPAVEGVYDFRLAVDDGWNGTATDDVAVLVANQGPFALAGPDRTVPKKVPAGLNGSASWDPEGDPLAYAWTQTGGPPVSLAGADTASPTFTPPTSGTYAFELAVDDGHGGTATDGVLITATNAPPVADAGLDVTAPKRVPVALDASASLDPDGDPLTYAWSQVGGPIVSLAGADTAAPSFTPTAQGAYAFRLAVDDGDGGTATDDVTVLVSNGIPAVDAGADRTVPKKVPLTLISTAGDPDGDPLAYAWTQLAGPPVLMSGADTAAMTFTPPRGGAYAFRLTVDDGDDGTGSDDVVVTATNAVPTADAGPDATARKGAPVTLDASASADPDGDPLAFLWTQVGGPPVTLQGADTATPTFTPSRSGAHAFRVAVDDGDGGVATDDLVVTVWGLAPDARLTATPSEAPPGRPFAFDASASADPDGAIVAYAFDFGDGTTANGTDAVRSHAYTRPGTYVVTLLVTDDDGNASSAQRTVTVVPAPTDVTVVGLGLAALAAVLLIALLAVRRRKREEEAEAPRGHTAGGTAAAVRGRAPSSPVDAGPQDGELGGEGERGP